MTNQKGPTEAQLCDHLKDGFLRRLQHSEERKQFFNKSTVLLSEQFSSETNVTILELIDVVNGLANSNSLNDTLQESANVIISNLTDAIPIGNRTRRQALMMLSVNIVYEFCIDVDLGDIIGGRPTADGTIMLITSDDQFHILNLAVGSLFTAEMQEKYTVKKLADLNKLGFNEIYGGEQRVTINLPLRVLNEITQMVALWTSPDAMCLQRLELQLPNGKRFRLLDQYDSSVHRQGENGIFVWFDRIGYCIII